MTDQVTYGDGSADDPWILHTPPGTSQYSAWREPAADPPALALIENARDRAGLAE